MERSLFPSEEPDKAPARWAGFARVLVNRSLDNEQGLTYGIPETMRGLRIGELVRVPLGRGNTRVDGVVVHLDTEIGDGVAQNRIKAISDRRQTGYPPVLIELARWMARYYCCPIGMVLGSMTPAAVRKGIGQRTITALELSGAEPLGKLSGKSGELWGRLVEKNLEGSLAWPLDPDALRDAMGERTKAGINKLLRLGLVREIEIRTVRAADGLGLDFEPARALTLSDDQARAVGSIAGTLGTFCVSLLFGITGSGKTEVYLRVLAEALERGESGIVLVPEISLTPQTVSRFVERFGSSTVAVLHSGLTGAQRNKEWTRIATGEARVVVGARSAVFAPFAEKDSAGKLGVIIVDEEHDTSYKQDQLPRYHARDVAIKRAQLESCPVILGSATPSLESWHNAVHGSFELVRLPNRVGGGKLPRVKIVDLLIERHEMREFAKAEGSGGGSGGGYSYSLGPTLRRALRTTLDRGGQAMLLLNRRGFANYCCCPDAECGWVLTCDQCDSSMVYHKAKAGRSETRGLPKGYVRCHHCLAQQLLPPSCPRCAKRTIALGTGTQRVEDELAKFFPELAQSISMVRVDSDAMGHTRDYHTVLDAFRRGETRVLLGTQMIAKGLDFPGVELIGVINADTALGLPDFRASERTYQLVSQVAGRAGRSERTSESALVIVQTMSPHERAIICAAGHDFESFANGELESRRLSGLPPVGRMARIVTRDEDAMKAEARIFELAHAVGTCENAAEIRVIGPAPCALSRLSGQYRFSIELLAANASIIQRALAHLRARGLAVSDAKTAIDVDPVSLL